MNVAKTLLEYGGAPSLTMLEKVMNLPLTLLGREYTWWAVFARLWLKLTYFTWHPPLHFSVLSLLALTCSVLFCTCSRMHNKLVNTYMCMSFGESFLSGDNNNCDSNCIVVASVVFTSDCGLYLNECGMCNRVFQWQITQNWMTIMLRAIHTMS